MASYNSSSAPQWVWSAPHQDSYYVTYDVNGQPVYHWYKQIYGTARTQRVDSGSHPYASGAAIQMPDPAPEEIRTWPGFIPGTPEKGWYERLDPSYRMRTGSEAQAFFKHGRVFAMLYSEAASETGARGYEDDAVTVVRFGETVFSQIRRFVVVSVRRNFVYVCGISTYSGRGATKSGCNPPEHAIVYFTGTSPVYYQGEYESGMTKEPIQVDPAEPGMTLAAASRIRFGKTIPIEWNVKVKDVGRVIPEHMSKLVKYWQDENQEMA